MLGFDRRALGGAAIAILTLSGCGMPPIQGARDIAGATDVTTLARSGKIQHVIVIIQENRTVDNLFNGFPGADTVQSGKNSRGQQVELRAQPLAAPYDLKHSHRTFSVEYDHGAMNGFDRARSYCIKASQCPPPNVRAYAYVPHDGIQPYLDMGTQYTFADEMFESNEGPSFPAHQYLVSGTSAVTDDSTFKASENPGHHLGGCDSPSGTTVSLIGPNGGEQRDAFPCFDRRSIFTLLDGSRISWRFYQANPGARLWNAVDALKPIWLNRTEYSSNVIVPSSKVLADIRNRKLAQVVMVTPTAKSSDHSGVTDGSGPDWVASIVNAVGKTKYWNSTVIFVTWDDWGGWYDHAVPKIYNSYELGMRVPLLVISPYAKTGYVSHVHYEFGSILKFIEATFNLRSLGTTDERANSLSDCFNFGKPGRRFEAIRTRLAADYFLRQPVTDAIPDSD